MADIRIVDMLTTEYSDFLEFCQNSDKQYKDELDNADYIAFRSQYGISRENISKLRKHIESFIAPDELSANDGIEMPIEATCDNVIKDSGKFVGDPASNHESKEHAKKSANSSNRKSCGINIHSANASSRIVESCSKDDRAEARSDRTVNLSMKSEIPLSQSFSVEYRTYCDMPLLESDIGTRAYNCLTRGAKQNGSVHSCITVGDLLQLSPRQISEYKYMGQQSFDRIISALVRLIPCKGSIDKEGACTKPSAASRILKTQVLNMLRDAPYDISSLSDEEKASFSEYVSACDAVGKDMALRASEGNETAFEVLHMLQRFYEEPLKKYNLKLLFEKCARTLPDKIKTLCVEPFLFAYDRSLGKKKTQFNFLLNSESTVLDFIHAVQNDAGNTVNDFNMAIPFLKWMNFDRSIFNNPLTRCLQTQNDNAQLIFEQRVLGKKLEAVGSSIGITRERVRQIEKKVSERVLNAYCEQRTSCDIILMINALCGGKYILSYDDIASYIGEKDAQILWHFAKQNRINRKGLYYFSPQSNTIVFGNELSHVELSSLFYKMPAIIDRSDMASYVTDISIKYGVPEIQVRVQLQSFYECDGLFYHKGRITVVFMCDYVLRTRFPNGYKISDESDQTRFLKYLEELFGNHGKITARALDSKIGTIGVLINRGMYLHSSYVNVEKAIIDEVNEYIDKSPRIVLTYAELFDTFSSRFCGTPINNRYCLQGVLKLMGCPFVMRKDYITKEKGANITSEFEHFIEQNGIVHKSVLLDEFNGLSEFNIGLFCQRLTAIVMLDGGCYMHASHLDISEDDYIKQRAFLLSACSGAPVSTSVLFNDYMMRFTDFMLRNNIETQGNLFGILQYMFRQEFYFSRPYISLTDKIDLTHRGVLLQHLSGINSIDIEDLTDICDKEGIRFLSTRTMLNSLAPDFIRVGKTTLMRKELVGIDDDCILDTAQQICDIVYAHGGYCASKNIDDFSWFPELNMPWNTYLLESIAALAGDLLTVLRINATTIYTSVDVYIGDNYHDEDINYLIVNLLKKECQHEPFVSKEDIFKWLQLQGLCNTKLPSFLETEGHLFYDTNGKVKVQ